LKSDTISSSGFPQYSKFNISGKLKIISRIFSVLSVTILQWLLILSTLCWIWLANCVQLSL